MDMKVGLEKEGALVMYLRSSTSLDIVLALYYIDYLFFIFSKTNNIINLQFIKEPLKGPDIGVTLTLVVGTAEADVGWSMCDVSLEALEYDSLGEGEADYQSIRLKYKSSNLFIYELSNSG